DADAFFPMLALVSRGATLGPMEMDLRKTGGNTVEALLRLSPIVLPDGRITAVSMSVRDLREKRLADRALRMHGDILENMPAAECDGTRCAHSRFPIGRSASSSTT